MSPAISKDIIPNHIITTTASQQRPQLLRSSSSAMHFHFFDSIEHMVHHIAHPFHRHDKDLDHERKIYRRHSHSHDRDLDFERKTYHKTRAGTQSSSDRMRDAGRRGVNFMVMRERRESSFVPDPRRENEMERERMVTRRTRSDYS
ncbi:hypothetical protein Vi05172_g6357 [Venturia inaequalis]|nr:hypothetical protein Vi05172_g6357 [Venturia inaequalis]